MAITRPNEIIKGTLDWNFIGNNSRLLENATLKDGKDDKTKVDISIYKNGNLKYSSKNKTKIINLFTKILNDNNIGEEVFEKITNYDNKRQTFIFAKNNNKEVKEAISDWNKSAMNNFVSQVAVFNSFDSVVLEEYSDAFLDLYQLGINISTNTVTFTNKNFVEKFLNKSLTPDDITINNIKENISINSKKVLSIINFDKDKKEFVSNPLITTEDIKRLIKECENSENESLNKEVKNIKDLIEGNTAIKQEIIESIIKEKLNANGEPNKNTVFEKCKKASVNKEEIIKNAIETEIRKKITEALKEGKGKELIKNKEFPEKFIILTEDINPINQLKIIYGLIEALGLQNEYIMELGVYGKQMNNVVVDKLNEMLSGENKQVILTGAPGTGKTFSAMKYIEFQIEKEEKLEDKEELKKEIKLRSRVVQFHSSYDYTDFIEGMKPAQVEKNNTFVKVDGVFKSLCRAAAKDPKHTYYMLIDEINRADLSRVFGELMYCLEYRGESGRMQTQYANLPTYKFNDDSGEAEEIKNDIFSYTEGGFYVPENVIIIGTMNDIDRSVESFDFALRRRFLWHNVKANDVMESAIRNMFEYEKKEALTILIDKAKKLNEQISSDDGIKLGLNEDYYIGPALYKPFKKENEFDVKKHLEDCWYYRIENILREYCRGRNADAVEKFIVACRTKLIGSGTRLSVTDDTK